VIDGFADIGILPSHMDIPPFLDVLAYRRDRLVAVIPVDHPLSRRRAVDFNELRDSNFIGMETGSSLQMLVARAAEQSGFMLKVCIEVMSFESAKAMVRAGFGVAVLPEIVVNESEIGGVARRVDISNDWAIRKHVICVKDKERLTASVALMMRHLLAPTALPTAAHGR